MKLIVNLKLNMVTAEKSTTKRDRTEYIQQNQYPLPNFEKIVLIPGGEEGNRGGTIDPNKQWRYFVGAGGVTIAPDGTIIIFEKGIHKRLYPEPQEYTFSQHGVARLTPDGKRIDYRSLGPVFPLLPDDENRFPHGVEDVRVTPVNLGNGEVLYFFTASVLNKTDWRKMDPANKHAPGLGCGLYVWTSKNPHDVIHTDDWIQPLGEIGPTRDIIRNAFFLPDLHNGNLVLVTRKFPNIQLLEISLDDLMKLANDPEFKQDFWEQEFFNRLDELTILSPQRRWELCRPGEKWSEGQIAGANVQTVEWQNPVTKDLIKAYMLIYNSPIEFDPETGKALGRHIGVALLDKDNPRKVLARGPIPIIEPTLPQEINGKVANVAFSDGFLIHEVKGKPVVQIYYAGADTNMMLAQSDLDSMMLWLTQFDQNGEKK